MIDAYVDGRPTPSSSIAFTSDGSVKRAGGEVVWPVGANSRASSASPRTSCGSRFSASSFSAAVSSVSST